MLNDLHPPARPKWGGGLRFDGYEVGICCWAGLGLRLIWVRGRDLFLVEVG